MFKKIAIIGGARPNFMKILPLAKELRFEKIPFFIINTGQHFSREMSDKLLLEFGLRPKYNLKPSPKSVVVQIADILAGLDGIFKKEKPGLVIVVGDVNSTLAGALAANKLKIKLVHIESGLRSNNYKMPEEYNRKITDHLADILFATSKNDIENLKKEKAAGKIYHVGNIMIDTLKYHLNKLPRRTIKEKYYFCTLHRAENVDDPEVLRNILDALKKIAKDAPIFLPLHPRMEKMARKFGYYKDLKSIFKLLPPLGYRETITFQRNARLILTDSGGIQEEASFLGIPCLTLRTETERPITIEAGTNTLAGVSRNSILNAYKNKKLERRKVKIPLWDGQTAKRIVKILKELS